MVTRTGTSITTTIERPTGLVVSAVRIGLGFTRRDGGRAGDVEGGAVGRCGGGRS